MKYRIMHVLMYLKRYGIDFFSSEIIYVVVDDCCERVPHITI